MRKFIEKNVFLIFAVVLISFIFSCTYADSAAGVLRVTRGGTGVENITEGQFLIGKNIDEMQATSSMSMDSAGNVTITKALDVASLTISAVTDGDLFVAGNIGIGTTTADFTLTIDGTNGIDPVSIASSSGASLFYINESGDIGIGTKVPSGKLDVVGDVYFGTSDSNIFYFNSNSGYTGFSTTSPVTEIDVNGLIRMNQNSTTTCSVAIQGAIHFSATSTKFWGCNGTNWVALD